MKSQQKQEPTDIWAQVMEDRAEEYRRYLLLTHLAIGKRGQTLCRMPVAKPSVPRKLKAMRSVSRNS